MNHGHYDDDYEDEDDGSDIEYLSSNPGASAPSTRASTSTSANRLFAAPSSSSARPPRAPSVPSADSSRPSSRASSNIGRGALGTRGGYGHAQGGGVLEQLMGMGGMGGMGGQMAQMAGLMGGYGGRYVNGGPPSAFDDYFKAFSVAVMPGNERPTLSYGGKIILPPSALVSLTQLDLESPWTFQLRNPKNPSLLKTHAGVLEFIADEGCCYLPYWMMKTLQLQEGDPIRLTGAQLPKGKMVKIQAQDVSFLEVSDPKAVLEGALRSFTTLTKGDIIEITYNSLTFEFLIMETTPEGPGINIIDTDLEVDFAAPKGYVEPERPAPAPVATMADKLKIDINSTTSAGTTRPTSAASSRDNVSIGAEPNAFESFKGMGSTLNGRVTKGKGKARKIEEVDKDSKIERTDKAKIVTNETLANDGRLVPAALHLPYGKLFFGYTYKPYDPKLEKKKVESEDSPEGNAGRTFGGGGATLSGRNPTGSTAPSSSEKPAQAAEPAEKKDPWAALGGGATLRAGSSVTPIEVDEDDSVEQEGHGDDDDGSEFNGFEDDDDDAIAIDSD